MNRGMQVRRAPLRSVMPTRECVTKNNRLRINEKQVNSSVKMINCSNARMNRGMQVRRAPLRSAMPKRESVTKNNRNSKSAQLRARRNAKQHAIVTKKKVITGAEKMLLK